MSVHSYEFLRKVLQKRGVGLGLSDQSRRRLMIWAQNPARTYGEYDDLIESLHRQEPWAFLLSGDQLRTRVFYHMPSTQVPHAHYVTRERVPNK